MVLYEKGFPISGGRGGRKKDKNKDRVKASSNTISQVVTKSMQASVVSSEIANKPVEVEVQVVNSNDVVVQDGFVVEVESQQMEIDNVAANACKTHVLALNIEATRGIYETYNEAMRTVSNHIMGGAGQKFSDHNIEEEEKGRRPRLIKQSLHVLIWADRRFKETMVIDIPKLEALNSFVNDEDIGTYGVRSIKLIRKRLVEQVGSSSGSLNKVGVSSEKVVEESESDIEDVYDETVNIIATKICNGGSGKEHGNKLLQSVKEGPFQYGTETSPATTRARTMDDLSPEEKIREACDVKETNIILQVHIHFASRLLLHCTHPASFHINGIYINFCVCSIKPSSDFPAISSNESIESPIPVVILSDTESDPSEDSPSSNHALVAPVVSPFFSDDHSEFEPLEVSSEEDALEPHETIYPADLLSMSSLGRRSLSVNPTVPTLMGVLRMLSARKRVHPFPVRIPANCRRFRYVSSSSSRSPRKRRILSPHSSLLVSLSSSSSVGPSCKRCRIMPATRSGMTPEAIEEVIAQRMAEALETYEANRNDRNVVGNEGDNGNGGGNGNENGGEMEN
ncbi:hypothetical protein Tco_0121424 [Tanacetum coccineum]